MLVQCMTAPGGAARMILHTSQPVHFMPSSLVELRSVLHLRRPDLKRMCTCMVIHKHVQKWTDYSHSPASDGHMICVHVYL